MDLLEMMKKSNMNGAFAPKPVSNVYEFYLTGHIDGPENYLDWFDTMRHANETDVIKIYVNCYGGDLFTAIQFMRVLAETNATVVCSVEGACMSAATVILLCCEHFEISPHSVFMFHNYSGGAIGKGGEMIDQLLHERKWSESLLRDVYKDFLTEDEIKSMLDNKDLWMDGEEVVKRLGEKAKKISKELQKAEKAEKPIRKAPVKKPAPRAKKPV